SKMVALDMKREAPGAKIVAPMDRNAKPGTPPNVNLPRYVIVLQRDYARAGQKPDAVTEDKLATLEAFAGNSALKQAADMLSGRGGFVHYARVGDSHFVVLVEQLYPWPIPLLLQRPLMCGLALVLAVAGASVAPRWYRARRSRAAGIMADGW